MSTQTTPPTSRSATPLNTTQTTESSIALRTRVLEGLSGRYRAVPVLIAIALIWAFFQTQNSAFLSPRNLTNLSVQIVVTAVLALGLVIILVTKEIDLSIAALSAVCAAVMAHLMIDRGMGAGTAMLLALLTGMVVGGVQGAVISRFRAPSFIVTLATSLVMQGVLLMLMPRSGAISVAGTPVQSIANSFLRPVVGYSIALIGALITALLLIQSVRHQRRQGSASTPSARIVIPVAAVLVAGFGVTFVLNEDRGVPTPVALLVIVLAAMFYLTTQTRLGTYLYAIGGNAEASQRAAISLTRVKITAFVFAGGFAALAGIIAASQTLGVSSQSGGGTLLLEAVAAAVIGGASLFGGRGSVWAALVGALLIGSIANGLALMDASTETKFVVQGLVLVLAVTADSLLARQTARS